MIQHKIYFCFTFFEKSRLKIVMTRCTCTYSFIKSYFLKLNVNRKNSLEKINLRLFCPTVLFYKNRFYKNSKGQKSLDNFEFPDKGFFVTLFKKWSKIFHSYHQFYQQQLHFKEFLREFISWWCLTTNHCTCPKQYFSQLSRTIICLYPFFTSKHEF